MRYREYVQREVACLLGRKCFIVILGVVGYRNKGCNIEIANKRWTAQEDLAERIFVSRQAVSWWETGETVPNTETLKQLSKIFDVSINTLLGSPRKLICQCCGMPLEDSILSKEFSGSRNKDNCQWCYTDEIFTYKDLNALIDFCVSHMTTQQ